MRKIYTKPEIARKTTRIKVLTNEGISKKTAERIYLLEEIAELVCILRKKDLKPSVQAYINDELDKFIDEYISFVKNIQ